MTRIPLKSGDEYDALTGWRKYLVVFNRAGIAKKMKRKYNKRFRKSAKAELRRMEEDT